MKLFLHRLYVLMVVIALRGKWICEVKAHLLDQRVFSRIKNEICDGLVIRS
jgi:hypothetical protein